MNLFILLILGLLSCSDDSQELKEETKQFIENSNSKLPKAIQAYQTGANSKNIDTYMSAFTNDIVIIDVSRTISGYDAVRKGL
jgi:ketosteroid isomerase-like protein